MCKIWFPLETFGFLTLKSTAAFLETSINTKNSLHPYVGQIVTFLEHCKTGIFSSYILSVSFLLLILHGTYAVDLCVLR